MWGQAGWPEGGNQQLREEDMHPHEENDEMSSPQNTQVPVDTDGGDIYHFEKPR